MFLIICTASLNSAHAPLKPVVEELGAQCEKTECFKSAKELNAIMSLHDMMKCGIVFSLLPVILYTGRMDFIEFHHAYLNALHRAQAGRPVISMELDQYFVWIMPEAADTHSPIEMDEKALKHKPRQDIANQGAATALPVFADECGVNAVFVNGMCKQSVDQLNTTFNELGRSKKLATLGGLLRMLQYIMGKTVPDQKFLSAVGNLEKQFDDEGVVLRISSEPFGEPDSRAAYYTKK